MGEEACPESNHISFAELGLRFGQEMVLMPDPGDKAKVFDCELIGCLGDESVIIGPPVATGVLPRLVEGQRIIVRIKMAGGMALFPSTVLFVSEIPTVMVYLDYPRDVKFKQVRGAFRVSVALPVLATNKTNPQYSSIAGKVVDISTSGARLEMFEVLGKVGDEIELKGKFEVGNIKRILSIDALIRAKNSTSAERGFYGIEFHEGNEDKLLVLLGFTFHAMAFGHIQNIR